MKRRGFLKLIGIAVTAPTALAAMPKKELTVAAANKIGSYTIGVDMATDIPNCTIVIWGLVGDKWQQLPDGTYYSCGNGKYSIELPSCYKQMRVSWIG